MGVPLDAPAVSSEPSPPRRDLEAAAADILESPGDPGPIVSSGVSSLLTDEKPEAPATPESPGDGTVTIEPIRATRAPIQISEIHYHPSASARGSEFIEIVNTGTETASLAGWKFTRGVSFDFPTTTLDPGEFAVIAESEATFRQHFGRSVSVAGEFTGRLDNAGELLRLKDDTDHAVSDVRYLDIAPWPEAADGQGASLQRTSYERDVDDPANWSAGPPTPGRPSAAPQGSTKLSLFDVRHIPARPGPGISVKIIASAFHLAAKAEAQLHFSDGRREHSLPMERESTRTLDGGGHESTFSSIVPPHSPSSVVRYWVTVRSSEGESRRSPLANAPTPSYAFFVEDPNLRSELSVYHLFVEPRSLSQLLRNPRSNRLYPATFVHEGRVHQGVQVRLRGAWARSWPKKSWKIFFPKNHRLSKRDRINLNSCWRDAAFIRETLAYEIYARCDALSLKTEMVRLQLNGQFWGLFVDVEQPKRRYLRRVGLPGAVLYKAASSGNQSDERLFGSAAEYERHYQKETHPEDSFDDLQDFCRSLASSRNVADFFATRLDLPRYINYLCATTLTQNWDAFNKNHFVAHDREGSGKWYVIPWDVDRTLGDHWNWSFSSTDLPILLGTRYHRGATGWNRLMDRFFGDPTLKKRFMDRLAELLETVFTEEELLPLVDRLAESIASEADLDRTRWGGHGDWRRAIEEVRRFIKKRREFLFSELPGSAPEMPRTLTPPDGARVASFPVVLKASPFRPGTTGATYASTHWQIREAGASYATPVLSLVSRDRPDSLSIARGLLLPETRYFWRVAHVDSRGKVSTYSAETSFRTGEFAFDAVLFDLSRHFNRDLVADPGDSRNDTVDGSRTLIVDGFDGIRTDNPLAGGLPKTGIVGLHRLGDYHDENALQMTPASSRDITIVTPPGRFSSVRFVVAGGNGDSRIPVLFDYDDGTVQRKTLTCNDWYQSDPPDRPPRRLGPGAVVLLAGMDRIRYGRFSDNNRPALFEVALPVDTGRTLTTIRLETTRAFYESRRTTFNLFAVTGIRAD